MQPPVDAHWDDGPGVLDVAGRYWRWLVLAGLLGALAAVGLTMLQPRTYHATANLFLATPDAENAFTEEDPDRRVRNQVERIRSREVAERAAATLGGGVTAESVTDATEVEAEIENDLISVTATAAGAERAAAIANALADAYVDSVEEQVQATTDQALKELEDNAVELRSRLRSVEERLADAPEDSALLAQRDAVAGQLATLSGRADQIAVDASLYGSGVAMVEPAVEPAAPDGRNLVRNGVAGLLLGLALGTAIGWRRARSNTKAQDRHDPGDVLEIPLLGSVPTFKSLGVEGVVPTLTDARSPAAEAYQFLLGALTPRLRRLDGHVIAVTSAQPGDGKTVTALNLAIAASRDERDVLLVDADARVRGLSRITAFNDGMAGLHELQQDPENLVWSESRRDLANVDGVEVVPVGSDIPDPAGFFRTPGFARAMMRMRDHADLVIIDCPPLLAVSDSWAVAEHVDGIVLVVAQGTSVTVLEEVRDRLTMTDAPILGYVFNRADEQGAPYAYQYDAYQSAVPDRTNTKSEFGPPPGRPGRPPTAPNATPHGIAAMQEGRKF